MKKGNRKTTLYPSEVYKYIGPRKKRIPEPLPFNQRADEEALVAGSDTSTVTLFDDFLYTIVGSGHYAFAQVNSAGTGSAVGPTPSGEFIVVGHPGVVRLQTGTTASGRAFLSDSTTDFVNFGNDEWSITFLIRTGPTLSDTNQTYHLRVGFNDVNTSDPTDGVIFHYSDGVNSGKWLAEAWGTSTSTTADTGITVAVDTWYKLKVSVNAGATVATFYIDDNQVATIEDTNVPTGLERTGFICGIIKTVGTTNRLFYVDYMRIGYTLTAPARL